MEMKTNKQLYLNLKEKYNFRCHGCGGDMWAKPSMFMTEFQMNLGGGVCTKCEVSMNLRIDSKNETMISTSRKNLPDHGGLPDDCYVTKDMMIKKGKK